MWKLLQVLDNKRIQVPQQAAHLIYILAINKKEVSLHSLCFISIVEVLSKHIITHRFPLDQHTAPVLYE